MPQMTYADLHCDSVTAACDAGADLADFAGQVNLNKLGKSGCTVQCFAIFTEGANAAADFERYAAFYGAQLKKHEDFLLPVRSFSDFKRAEEQGKVATVLTVENLGFTGGDEGEIAKLSQLGVKMASPVWNTENALAYPNLIFKGGVPDFSARENRGLKEAGRRILQALEDSRIIADISHLSDGGAEDILALSSKPVVASHSNAYGVCPVSRNLTDGLIKKLADKGGCVGLNFCRDFIGNGDVFENLYRHYLHLVKVGGEELPALGTDFDGIPAYPELADCTFVTALLSYFADRGVSFRALEKFARGNFMRVFYEVVG